MPEAKYGLEDAEAFRVEFAEKRLPRASWR
jgi:hypothetical protein